MKEIETRLPLQAKDVDKGPKEYLTRLKYLLQDPDFFKQILLIREAFNLPAYGVKGSLRNKDKFSNVMSLIFDNQFLKTLSVRKKSRQREFQAKVSKILNNFNLPERFRYSIAEYIIYNRFPEIAPYLCRCLVKAMNDCGQIRLFVEVFGDTKKQDLIRAWKDVKSMQKKYNIPGEHLYRYRNYYKHRLIASGQDPVDTMGMPMVDESINSLASHEKRIYKHRFNKHLNKDNSK